MLGTSRCRGDVRRGKGARKVGRQKSEQVGRAVYSDSFDNFEQPPVQPPPFPWMAEARAVRDRAAQLLLANEYQLNAEVGMGHQLRKGDKFVE